MNSILMSIRPEWAVKEMNGEKTEEIRKNLGKLKPPFKVYAYVTKHNHYKDSLYLADDNKYDVDYYIPSDESFILNGKVCYEFVCDRVEKIKSKDDSIWISFIGKENKCFFDDRTIYTKELGKASCLTEGEMAWYGRDGDLYSLHISELKIYDKPKELGEFHKVGFNEAMKNWEWDRLSPPDERSILIPCPAPRYEIKKAPQSFIYVEEKQDE